MSRSNSKVKVNRDKNGKTAASSSSRRDHCVAAGGDKVTGVHANGGLRAVYG